MGETFSRCIECQSEKAWDELAKLFPLNASVSHTIGTSFGSVTFFGETEDEAATKYYKWATSNGIVISARGCADTLS